MMLQRGERSLEGARGDAQTLLCRGIRALNVSCSFVYGLQERIALLESKLRQHGIDDIDDEDGLALGISQNTPLQPVPQPAPPPSAPSSQAARAAEAHTRPTAVETEETLAQVLRLTRTALEQTTSSHDYIFSKILLAGLMASDSSTNRASPVGRPPPATEDGHILANLTEDLEAQPIQLPDRRSAEYFVKAYFEFANFSLPLLHEPTFRGKLESLYTEETSSSTVEQSCVERAQAQTKLAMFFANMVFAIGLLTLHKQDASKVPTNLCDRYYRTALGLLDSLALPNDVEGVQALLLITQYSYLHPKDLGVWDTVGLALRRAVKLGFHLDPPCDSTNALTLDTIRRTFWVAYSMDRNLALSTGRPMCISDGVITAQVS